MKRSADLTKRKHHPRVAPAGTPMHCATIQTCDNWGIHFRAEIRPIVFGQAKACAAGDEPLRNDRVPRLHCPTAITGPDEESWHDSPARRHFCGDDRIGFAIPDAFALLMVGCAEQRQDRMGFDPVSASTRTITSVRAQAVGYVDLNEGTVPARRPWNFTCDSPVEGPWSDAGRHLISPLVRV